MSNTLSIAQDTLSNNSICLGINVSRPITSRVYFNKGILMEFNSTFRLDKNLSLYTEYGFSNYRENEHLEGYNIEQKSHYFKLGLEIDELSSYNKMFFGFALGPTFLDETAAWFVPGIFFDDYVDIRFNRNYVNWIIRLYGGVNKEINDNIKLKWVVSASGRTLGNAPVEYIYYVPGFGAPMGEFINKTISTSLLLVIKLH